MSTDRMGDEADRWFYDLGKLAQVVKDNKALSVAAQEKADAARKRTLVLTAFVLFAFLLLAWRSELNADRISANSEKIVATQNAACVSNLEIVKKFNAQQNRLAAIDRKNRFIDDPLREERIMAYEDGRVIPLPICSS